MHTSLDFMGGPDHEKADRYNIDVQLQSYYNRPIQGFGVFSKNVIFFICHVTTGKMSAMPVLLHVKTSILYFLTTKVDIRCVIELNI